MARPRIKVPANCPGDWSFVGADPEDVADKIKLALSYSHDNGHTIGRERIIEIGLGSDKIANRIISVYQTVLKKSKS